MSINIRKRLCLDLYVKYNSIIFTPRFLLPSYSVRHIVWNCCSYGTCKVTLRHAKTRRIQIGRGILVYARINRKMLKTTKRTNRANRDTEKSGIVNSITVKTGYGEWGGKRPVLSRELLWTVKTAIVLHNRHYFVSFRCRPGNQLKVLLSSHATRTYTHNLGLPPINHMKILRKIILNAVNGAGESKAIFINEFSWSLTVLVRKRKILMCTSYCFRLSYVHPLKSAKSVCRIPYIYLFTSHRIPFVVPAEDSEWQSSMTDKFPIMRVSCGRSTLITIII